MRKEYKVEFLCKVFKLHFRVTSWIGRCWTILPHVHTVKKGTLTENLLESCYSMQSKDQQHRNHPGSSLDMQNINSYPGLLNKNLHFEKRSQLIYMHVKIQGALVSHYLEMLFVWLFCPAVLSALFLAVLESTENFCS